MKQGFWKELQEPFFVLAPLADVTDAPFRRIIAKYGKPDVMWTEFVSADGLFLADEVGKEKLMRDLLFTDAERPIVAQFFTAEPDMMERAAVLARKHGFDGVDINMGCPDRSIEKQGAGAALIKNVKRAQELIYAAQRGAGDLPVSVKTRIGYNKNELDTWISALLETNLAALTVHARTRKEMSLVPAQWDEVARAVSIRNECRSSTRIIGNGDALSLVDAQKKREMTGCDGVMLGRAIFGNPWLWSGHEPSVKEKLSVLIEHAKLFETLLPHKSFAIMKKHFKSYVSGFDGSKELRMMLMECESASAIEHVISNRKEMKSG
ncbi:MAG TPA: tRNA-dihydrouridine synthase [Candidatus Paceibacterota bacterium]